MLHLKGVFENSACLLFGIQKIFLIDREKLLSLLTNTVFFNDTQSLIIPNSDRILVAKLICIKISDLSVLIQ